MKAPFIVWMLSALCAAAQGIVLEGTTTHAITHEPLPGVHVRLVLAQGMDPNSLQVFGAISDRTGHFRVGELEPGMYMLLPELRGFIYGQKRKGPMPMTSVQVKAGVNESLSIEMTPRGTVSGRVLDLNGEPLPGAPVRLNRVDNDVALGDPMMGDAVSLTDDRGIFRLSGMPGRYYVHVSDPHGGDVSEIRTDGSAAGKTLHTYYPSASSKDRATVVELRPGAETAGIDIRISSATVTPVTFSINGVVTGAKSGEDVRPPTVAARSKNRNAPMWRITDPDGSFSLPSMEPGEYELVATQGDAASAPATVSLTNGDLAKVELRLIPGSSITGRLIVDGDPPGPLKDKWQVQLTPVEMWVQGGAVTADVESTGTFQLSGVMPLPMRLRLSHGPEGSYLRSATLDGVAMDEQGDLRFTGHDSQLDVTVSRKGAVLSGTVQDADGSKLENPMGQVVLVSASWQANLSGQGLSQVEISKDGKYEFKGVPPGKYRLLAVDLLRSGILDAESWNEFMAKGKAGVKEFEVKEDDHLTMDVKIAVKEKTDGKK